MAIFNDLDLSNWQEAGVSVDSLQIYPSRDKSGKHKNIYHGNFIPQIARELILRYTKAGEVVVDPFLGGGTTLYECESLGRKCLGADINPQILEFVREQMRDSKADFALFCGDKKMQDINEAYAVLKEKFGK